MKKVSVEKYIEKLECDVYPITFIKFLLNKKKILSYFAKAASENFELRVRYKVDTSDCEICKEKKEQGILCRKHTSIHRVITGQNVAFDLDTQTYFYKNEIFRMVGKRLVIIYCPHPKLITGEITDEKVRKINPITIEDPELLELPRYRKVREYISSELLDQHLKAWFNDEFSIITIPEDRNSQNWCLVANH
ncbi:MAG: hypothetical protein ACTSWJ_08720 [Candidatus Heimdallarchaeaceae archaeon]